MHSTRGYSRDHRPDLNQVMLELLVEHQAGLSLLMQPRSGHSRAVQAFGPVIQAHLAQLQTTSGLTDLVAESRCVAVAVVHLDCYARSIPMMRMGAKQPTIIRIR